MDKPLRCVRGHEIKAALLLIAMGAALRLALIGGFPPGLNQDEASAGYEAWSLLRYGMDRNGNSWPVLFASWGSGQNVLYSYLSLPFIALFGLNEVSLRLLMGLSGSAALILFWLTARRVGGAAFGLCALLALALNPWHILASRWALESNLLPFTLLLGLFFLVLADDEPRMLPPAAAVFALSLYAYGTAFIFLPFFLTAASLIMFRRKTVGPRAYVAALLVFSAVALPITICNVRNMLGYGQTSIFGLTLPKLTEARQSAVTVFGGDGRPIAAAFDNFIGFLRILARQSDGLPWNSAGKFGLLYGPAGLLLALAGIISRLLAIIGGRARKGELYVFAALLSSLAASFFIEPNINRMNMVFIPLVWYQAEGMAALIRNRKRLAPVLAAAFLLAGALFARFYFTAYARSLAPSFHEGLGEAIKYADSLGGGFWTTYDVNMPYIYVLFYTRYPADKFAGSVEYLDPGGAFRRVSSFGEDGAYRFGNFPPENAICIVEASDAGARETLAVFGNYAVVKS